MAGTIEAAPGVRWSAASWLFDWVLETVAGTVEDATLAGELRSVVSTNVGWLALDRLTAEQLDAVRAVICGPLVDRAAGELPPDLEGRDRAVALVGELAAVVCR